MVINFGGGIRSGLGPVSGDVPGFLKAKRYVVLSEIRSSTIPNILDMFFGLLPFGTDFIPSTTKKTRVLVINQSEVLGTYYGTRDARTRNVIIHHGFADCSINEIQGDTPIIFTDVDWNIIEDCPDAIEIGRKNGRIYDLASEVNVSYDATIALNSIYRKESGKEIMIPPPIYYEEKDMAIVGGMDGYSYANQVADAKEAAFTMPEDRFFGMLYKTSLNELIDQNTEIAKLNISVDILTNRITLHDGNMNDLVEEISAMTKYSLEKYGFSGCEIIYGGPRGFNITKLKSALNLSRVEQQLNYMCLLSEITELNNNNLYEDLDAYECNIIMTLNYSNVKVTIADKTPIIGEVTTTDSNVLGLSTQLKTAESTYNYA